ncbi:MAG: hypothetical protein ACLFU6_12810 [Candidatus Hydrogenedentota bacterium]
MLDVDGVRRITLDVETFKTRNPRVIDALRRVEAERTAPKNKSKADQERWNTLDAIEERTQAAVEESATDILLAEPLAICWIAEGEEYTADLMRNEEAEQLNLLSEVWDSQAAAETIWAGHNVSFDLGVVLNRWRHHGITPPRHFPKFVNNRWRGRVWDSMMRTPSKNPLGFVSLDLVTASYGLDAKQAVEWDGAPMTGARVGAAFEAGAFDVIIAYCLDDCRVQDQLYLRQTANETWGHFDSRADIADQIAEIQNSPDLNEGSKAIAILTLLENTGMLPVKEAA